MQCPLDRHVLDMLQVGSADNYGSVPGILHSNACDNADHLQFLRSAVSC